MSTGELATAIHRVVADIDAATSPQDVVDFLAGFAGQYAVSGILLSVPSFTGDMAQADYILGAHPASLAAALMNDTGLNTDAVVQRVKKEMQALLWSGDTNWHACKPEARALKDALDAHGMTGGLLVPTFGSSGMSGLVVLAGNELALDDTAVTLLKTVSIYAFDRACALQRASLRSEYGLSDREFECMKWVAAGKTDWEIGQILTISPKTVNYHVENAKRKMSVPTRVQAVMAALLSGGIGA